MRAVTVTGAGQVTSGASATGGGGGGGVGALGVLLHPAQQMSASSVRESLMNTTILDYKYMVVPMTAARFAPYSQQ